MSTKKPTHRTSSQKDEANEKVKWNNLGENNLMYTVNDKGFLFLRIDLNKVYKPSKSFYAQGSKKNTNILISSTSGNKQLLEGENSDLRVSVNVYREMTAKEIEEWEKKS